MPETAARHLDFASPLSARRSGPLRGKVRVPGDKSHTTPTTSALLQQTRTIPIVFTTVGDPIGSGFVALPPSNITGFNLSEPTQAGKWVELLKEVERALLGSRYCSTQHRRRMPNIG
jgi:hypothetical protein